MICETSSLRRRFSLASLPRKVWTASGSSTAESAASARRPIAPIGVLSSWVMLATKSRRVSLNRRSAERSSPITTTAPLLRGTTRTASWTAGSPAPAAAEGRVRPPGPAPGPPRRGRRPPSAPSEEPRTRPQSLAKVEQASTASESETTATAARSGASISVRCCRSTTRPAERDTARRTQTQTASAPSPAPNTRPSRAEAMGVMLRILGATRVTRIARWGLGRVNLAQGSPTVHLSLAQRRVAGPGGI